MLGTNVISELIKANRRRGRPLAMADAQIAAIAIQHGLILATRNTRDFEPTGVPPTNPWTSATGST